MKNCFDRTPHTMKDWLLLAAGVAAVFAAADWLPGVLRGAGAFLGLLAPFGGGLLLAYVLDIPTRFFAQKLFGGRSPRRTGDEIRRRTRRTAGQTAEPILQCRAHHLHKLFRRGRIDAERILHPDQQAADGRVCTRRCRRVLRAVCWKSAVLPTKFSAATSAGSWWTPCSWAGKHLR